MTGLTETTAPSYPAWVTWEARRWLWLARSGQGQSRTDLPKRRGYRRRAFERRSGPSASRKVRPSLICLVDTPGALPSLDAEERGLGNAIASTMALMAGLKVPSIATVIGEGGSEGALSLAVADRVLMMENAIYSVISPEAAAGLIYQDEDRADEVAESLKLTAWDCSELGISDVVVREPPGGAHTNPDEAARELRRVLLRELAELQAMSIRRVSPSVTRSFGRWASTAPILGRP